MPAVEHTPYNKGYFMEGSLIHSTPQGLALLQLLSHALIELMFLCHLIRLSPLPLLVWINRHNMHPATICHIPVGQLLCIILTNIFIQRATGVWTALTALCIISWWQQQLYVVRCQLEQPGTQQAQRCHRDCLWELLLCCGSTTTQQQLACGAAEAAAWLLGGVHWGHSTVMQKTTQQKGGGGAGLSAAVHAPNITFSSYPQTSQFCPHNTIQTSPALGHILLLAANQLPLPAAC